MADDKETKCDKCLTDNVEPGKWFKSAHEDYLELIKFNALGQWSLHKNVNASYTPQPNSPTMPPNTPPSGMMKEDVPSNQKNKVMLQREMGTKTNPPRVGKVGVLKE